MSEDIGFEVRISHPYDPALDMTIEALKAEGFGVMISNDIANPQVILGIGELSKNPEIEAVSQEAQVSLERIAEALATA